MSATSKRRSKSAEDRKELWTENWNVEIVWIKKLLYSHQVSISFKEKQ
jgi:hypothetical protein